MSTTLIDGIVLSDRLKNKLAAIQKGPYGEYLLNRSKELLDDVTESTCYSDTSKQLGDIQFVWDIVKLLESINVKGKEVVNE